MRLLPSRSNEIRGCRGYALLSSTFWKSVYIRSSDWSRDRGTTNQTNCFKRHMTTTLVKRQLTERDNICQLFFWLLWPYAAGAAEENNEDIVWSTIWINSSGPKKNGWNFFSSFIICVQGGGLIRKWNLYCETRLKSTIFEVSLDRINKQPEKMREVLRFCLKFRFIESYQRNEFSNQI